MTAARPCSEPQRCRAAAGAAIVVLLAALAGGANPALAAKTPPAELRAYVNDRCVLADEPFYQPQGSGDATARSLTLLGLIVGKLAGLFMQQAVGAAASELGTRTARTDTRYAVAKQTSLYVADLQPRPAVRLNGRLGCLTIVAGRFRPDEADCRAQYVPRTVSAATAALPPEQWRTDRSDDSLENPLRRAAICLERALAVYEARFEFSADGTAYRLRNAGYRVDELLTTARRDAQRNVFYTLDVRAPGRTKEPELLSTAWVDLGRPAVGARDAGGSGTTADPPWLRVPPLSAEARRYYDEATRVHQESADQIDALQRAIARNERVLATLEQQRRESRGALAQSLRAEVVRTQTQGLALQAELDARRAEYASLRQEAFELMPVSIEIGVTETSSERKALHALAGIIESNRNAIATAALDAASGLVARRSLDDASSTAPAVAPGNELDAARRAYYDAQVEARFGSDAPEAERQAALARARQRYEDARRAAAAAAGAPATTPGPGGAP
ncbi:MAG: hypothetical protein U1F11_06075 [Steroidobacteraceae bacterium]